MEVAAVFLATTLQAGMSAILALALGLLASLGLLWLEDRWPTWAMPATALILLPSAAPVLLFLVAVAKILPWARGFWGIVFVHSTLNIGLVAVAIAQITRARLGGMAELALVEGSSRRLFLRRGVIPAMRSELTLLFIFVFALCFASFAVPLTLGGSRATTVEVLIYQKLRIDGQWSAAVLLAALQVIALLALSFWIGPQTRKEEQLLSNTSVRRKMTLLHWAPGLFIAFLPGLFLLKGMTNGWLKGYAEASATLLEDGPRLLAGSVLIGFGTGAVVTLALMLLAYWPPHKSWQKLWRGFATPSPTLIGFALLVMWRALGFASYGKIIFGLGLLWLPTFYRYRWEALLSQLESQIAVARVLGASEFLIFRRVVGPQCLGPALKIGGLAAFWAWGDFALSRVVAERTLTLAMAAQEMLESYRFDGATFVVWLAVLGGLFNFAIFAGAAYVFGEKSPS